MGASDSAATERTGRQPSEIARDSTFLFADLAGYTALTETHGDDARRLIPPPISSAKSRL